MLMKISIIKKFVKIDDSVKSLVSIVKDSLNKSSSNDLFIIFFTYNIHLNENSNLLSEFNSIISGSFNFILRGLTDSISDVTTIFNSDYLIFMDENFTPYNSLLDNCIDYLSATQTIDYFIGDISLITNRDRTKFNLLNPDDNSHFDSYSLTEFLLNKMKLSCSKNLIPNNYNEYSSLWSCFGINSRLLQDISIKGNFYSNIVSFCFFTSNKYRLKILNFLFGYISSYDQLSQNSANNSSGKNRNDSSLKSNLLTKHDSNYNLNAENQCLKAHIEQLILSERNLNSENQCLKAHVEQLILSERNLNSENICLKGHVEQLIQSERNLLAENSTLKHNSK